MPEDHGEGIGAYGFRKRNQPRGDLTLKEDEVEGTMTITYWEGSRAVEEITFPVALKQKLRTVLDD